MTNRRQFLASSIASAAVMTSANARAATFVGGASPRQLGSFVFDERVDHGAAMAKIFAPDAVRTYAVGADLSDVWYNHLAPGLRSGARAIGGLTNVGGLFVLSRLGYDAGLNLTLHGTHRAAAGGQTVQHVLDAPALIKQHYEAALATGTPWMPALRAALIEAASMPSAGRVAQADVGPLLADAPTTLHSWLLVPRD